MLGHCGSVHDGEDIPSAHIKHCDTEQEHSTAAGHEKKLGNLVHACTSASLHHLVTSSKSRLGSSTFCSPLHSSLARFSIFLFASVTAQLRAAGWVSGRLCAHRERHTYLYTRYLLQLKVTVGQPNVLLAASFIAGHCKILNFSLCFLGFWTSLCCQLLFTARFSILCR